MRSCGTGWSVLLSPVLRLLLPTALFFTCCTPQAPVASVLGEPTETAVVPEVAKAAPPAPPEAPARAPQVVNTVISGIPIAAVTFDSRTQRLTIADQPGGPGSRWADAEAAAKDLGGIAAVNGGFFTPEGKPLGLLVKGGKLISPPNNSSSLGAGIYAEQDSPVLLRRERGSDVDEILQSGPFLVENGRDISGLSTESSTARTILGWDGRHGWFIARTGACSLAGLAKALAGADFNGVKVRTVLNLDGGRSSDLWVSSKVPGGPVSQRPFWNKPVRNFLVLIPRP